MPTLAPPLPAGCALVVTPGTFRDRRDRTHGFDRLRCGASLRGLKTAYQAVEAFKAHACAGQAASAAQECSICRGHHGREITHSAE